FQEAFRIGWQDTSGQARGSPHAPCCCAWRTRLPQGHPNFKLRKSFDMTTTVSVPSSRGTRLIARASAEALGTLFLVVIGVGVLIFINPQAVPMPAPLAGGLAVAAAMLAFGYLSGGHF